MDPNKTKCFLHVGRPQSWNDSETCCNKYGGHLASLSSVLEQNFAQSLCGESINSCWIGGRLLNSTISGFQWTWSDNSQWNKSIFPLANVPLNCTGTGRSCLRNSTANLCAVMTNNSKSLMSERCDNPHASLCILDLGMLLFILPVDSHFTFIRNLVCILSNYLTHSSKTVCLFFFILVPAIFLSFFSSILTIFVHNFCNNHCQLNRLLFACCYFFLSFLSYILIIFFSISDMRCNHMHCHRDYLVILAVVSGLILSTTLAVVVWLLVFKRGKKRRRSRKLSDPATSLPSWKVYTKEELRSITKNFSEGNRLAGDTKTGGTYSGVQPDGSKVAVKRIKRSSFQRKKEFNSAIGRVARLRHPNLVAVMGCCYDHGDRYIVYEFVANGPLDKWLHHIPRGGRSLDWAMRMQIATTLAQGIA